MAATVPTGEAEDATEPGVAVEPEAEDAADPGVAAEPEAAEPAAWPAADPPADGAGGACPVKSATAAANSCAPVVSEPDVEPDDDEEPVELFAVGDDFELVRLPVAVPVSFWPSATAVRAVSKTLPKGGPL